MKPRTIGVIYLGPLRNTNKNYQLYSLCSGETIICSQFSELPIPIDVVNFVEYVAKNIGRVSQLVFYYRKFSLYCDNISIVLDNKEELASIVEIVDDNSNDDEDDES